MIRVALRRGILGTSEVEVFEVAWTGQSAADVLASRWPEEWKDLPVAVALNGRKLSAEELGLGLPDGVELVAAPDPQGLEPISWTAIFVYAIITAAISAAVSYIVYTLTPKPKPPDVPQDNDDAASPTYGFSGLSTTYGQGYLIPVVLGEHDAGGQVISTSVAVDYVAAPLAERAQFIVALSEGRIEGIGSETGGALGEANALGGISTTPPGSYIGPLPAGVRVNGNAYDPNSLNPGLQLWLRCGELDQSALPPPFVGASVVQAVGENFNDTGARHSYTINDTEPIHRVALILTAPGGVFRLVQGNAQIYGPIVFGIRWRPVGETTWRNFYNPQRGSVAASISFAGQVLSTDTWTEKKELALTATAEGVSGPIEVELNRTTPGLGTLSGSDTVTWRQVEWSAPHRFGYGGLALIGVDVEATERVNGAQPRFQIRTRGVRVRAWDPVSGFSPRSWQVPTAAPWNIYTHPIGRNPAWLAVEFLTARWGLGRWISSSQIDLEAFGRWAIYCDEPAGTWADGPRYRFDGVLDRQAPAWETLQQIASSAGAAIFFRGDQVSVIYRFRDAHGIGTPFQVAAKARSQLFSAALLRDVAVRWLPVADRPTIRTFQFLNAAKDFAGDALDVEDPDALFDPTEFGHVEARKQTDQAFGVTRASQLFRQGVWEHRVARQVTKEVEFSVPFFALAAEVGDVVGVQIDFVLPYANEALGLTIRTGGTATTTVAVDQALELAGGKTYELLARDPEGAIAQATITSAAGTYAAGDLLSLASAVDVDPGAPAAIGVVGQVVEDFEIVSISLEQNLDRRVRAVLWTPNAYDVPDPSLFDDGSPPEISESVGNGDIPQTIWSEVFDEVSPEEISIRRDLETAGHWISFRRPASRLGGAARVYVRRPGSTLFTFSGLVEAGRSSVYVENLSRLETIEVAVVLENRSGIFGQALAQHYAELIVPEFPPVQPTAPSGAVLEFAGDAGVRVRWNRQDGVGEIEIRRGSSWADGQVVAVLPGSSSSWVDPTPRPLDVSTNPIYWLASRAAGVYSNGVAVYDLEGLTGPGQLLPATAERLILAELVDNPTTGTLDRLAWATDDDGREGYSHQDEELEGLYTSPTLVLKDDTATEFTADAYWTADADSWTRDAETVDSWTWSIVSGESLWRSIDLRPASLARPGVHELTIDQVYPDTITLDDLDRTRPELLAYSRDLEPGARAGVELESRYWLDGAWSAWSRHRNGRRRASRIQVRAFVWRESFDLVTILEGLTVSAYL